MSHHMTRFDSRRGARAENQLRTAMLDTVTHELRTALTSIKASVTALLTNSRLRPFTAQRPPRRDQRGSGPSEPARW